MDVCGTITTYCLFSGADDDAEESRKIDIK